MTLKHDWLKKRISDLMESINIENIVLGGEGNLIISHIVSAGVQMVYA